MQQRTIEYWDGEQKLVGKLFRDASGKGPQPGIVVFHAFEGRGEFALEYAEHLAKEGYTAFAADVYGDAATADTLDGCMKLIKPFLEDRSMVRRRAQLAYKALSELDGVDTARLASIGFCFGGMCALELARSGAEVQATVTAHGVLGQSDLPTEAIQGSVLILHGYRDPQVPPESLDAFAREMDAAGVQDWTFTFFGNAEHSFTDPRTGSFDAQKEPELGRKFDRTAAERSYRYALDFFAERLG